MRQGLTTEQVAQSRIEHGHNVITTAPGVSPWKILGEKFADPVIRVLLVAAGLSLAIGIIENNYLEPVGIVVAIALATGISFWFEWDAGRKFDLLRSVDDDLMQKVIREGGVMQVARRDIVVGDLVLLETGDEIPADGRLVEAGSLLVNESTFTGEPVTSKTIDPAHFDSEATYPSNRLLRGTTVAEGSATLEVDAVGDATEYGRVALNVSRPRTEKSPLTRQLDRLSSLIGKVGVSMAVAIFVILAAKGLFVEGGAHWWGWYDALTHLLGYFMVAVAIIVMAVPEGLPMSITLSLAMSMRRMLRTNNLVRKMHACETMGAVTVICTDKTGTLTQNRMQVRAMDLLGEMDRKAFNESLAVNSTAFIDAEGQPVGNPTEGALLLWIREQGEDYRDYRDRAVVVDRMPFSAERKMMASLVESPVAGRRMLYVKGAPEFVLALCGEGILERHTELLHGYQRQAMRTLAVAWSATDAATCEEALREKLTPAAIVAIADPVREDVPSAVAECLAAGIAIKVVTGDTSATAIEIARQIGLWGEGDTLERNHITGAGFEAMSDEQLLAVVGELRVMSRARPLDKQRLVMLLQQTGQVVAVTGDGTNDAPALRMAQVGLSMGSGTSVAKEASDITLLDDSFATIANAVMWGRSLYKNIGRFVMFQLTVNVAALAVVFAGSIFGHQMPLTITQMLWINLIMDTFAAMALASLPPSRAVMNERPRPADQFIITLPMRRMILGAGGLFAVALLSLLVAWGDGVTVYRQSMFFTLFVMLQVWNLLNARSFGSTHGPLGGLGGCRTFLLTLVLIVVGQYLIVTFGGEALRTVPLSARDWMVAVIATVPTLLLGYIARMGKKKA
ncbi:calcium-translocating P-type ATPase, PMCA-type [Bacteroidia bacterium]|nr:calcium-translocating P-type ATPase, PMCA-type [Bacteroidia bacterium]